MADSDTLKRNLLALSSTDPHLASRLSDTEPDRTVRFIRSKTNHLVPSYEVGGRFVALHSRFDPIREGRRYLEAAGDASFLIFLGLGAGYQVEGVLENGKVVGALIIEKGLGMVRSVLERIDMRRLLMDARIKILIDANLTEVSHSVITHYLPAIAGDLKTLSLPARINREKEYFQNVLRIVNSSLEQIAQDYTVQSQFGVKWFINTLSNMKKAESVSQVLRPVRRALVTGAGPSLEDQIEVIRDMKEGAFLIAADTSLPFLLSQDVKPDLVISIDCQHVSYHHFLSGYPDEIPLVLDLASPTMLTRLTDRVVFFSSGHPFSRYLGIHWRGLPLIDTSGGNVSHAALSLANALGAEEVFLFGVDFSYPEGKAYARATYLYPFFRSLETRILPLESRFFTFLFSNRDIIKEKTGDTIRYTTRPMVSYKERIEIAARDMDARIEAIRGRGLKLAVKEPVSKRKPGTSRNMKTILSQGVIKTDWKSFMRNYRISLQSIDPPTEPFGEYWEKLPQRQREIWFTLLPLTAAFKRKRQNMGPAELLSETRDWSVSILERYLE